MYLSNRTSRFLNAAVLEYRARCRRNDGLNVMFNFQYLKIRRFRRFSEAEAEMCLQELNENGLIRRYTDGGFAITFKAIALYDEKHRKPFIRVFWFISGAVFTTFLEFAVALLNKVIEST